MAIFIIQKSLRHKPGELDSQSSLTSDYSGVPLTRLLSGKMGIETAWGPFQFETSSVELARSLHTGDLKGGTLIQ